MNQTPQPARTPPEPDPDVVDLDEFSAAFGADLLETLDVGTWKQGPDLEALNRRLASEVAEAVAQERDAVAFIRREVFPRLKNQLDAPAEAGVYQARPEDINRACEMPSSTDASRPATARSPSTKRWCSP